MVFAGAKLRKEYLIAVFIMASFESLSLISWNKFNIFTEKINVLQLIIRNMIGNILPGAKANRIFPVQISYLSINKIKIKRNLL
jgi:hypothetical protein